jgi:asparagine synthase (glutamine-hydrolysing)
MCGIAGFWAHQGLSDSARSSLKAMTDAIIHRGPDDGGGWFDDACGIALGSRRLAIVDLSPAGHQPMASASGRYVIVYNGEIYNHTDLRLEIDALGDAPTWRGHSDTEVLLAALDRWGIEPTLRRLNGMFAFAIWDRRERALYLARDRLGEKPLYYGEARGVFLFGSELKVLRAHPAFQGEVDRDALALFFRYGHVPAPDCIWRGIRKLPAATYIVISENGRKVEGPNCYWDFGQIAQSNAANLLPGGPSLTDELEVLLKDAVRRRMVADVPLGAFLSGGVDSSAIVALMQAQSTRPVRTFSIGFHERDYNEANYAGAVAAHLGTDHTQLYVSAQDSLATIPQLPAIWDEPFSDSSQIPTFLISRMARAHVTVSLSGDGGDELFAGYNRHVLAASLGHTLSGMPASVRHLVASAVRSEGLAKAVTTFMRALPKRHRLMALSDRLPKIAHLLEAGASAHTLHRKLISHWQSPSDIVRGAREPQTAGHETGPSFADPRQSIMYLDTISYLPDDVLTKVDRASMAVSLEVRVPFLDHRLVEFAWRIPMAEKIRNGVGKQILRNVLYRHVPQGIIDRPKMGFSVPIAAWLSGPLRDWAENLLNETRLSNEGFLNPLPIRQMWSEHTSGKRSHATCLWDVLMFQAWLQEQRGVKPYR